jgi:spore maturation protein CgeB
MNILLTTPGNLRTVPMSRYVHETLSRMGHEVVLFDYSSGSGIYPRILRKLSEDGLVEFMDKRLMRLVEHTRPDVLLTIYGFNHSPAALDRLRAMGVPTACWWLNDPFQFDRSALKAGHYDFYFTNCRGVIPEYESRGLTNIHYLPVGIFPDVHRRLDGVPKSIDVCFAGDWSPLREDILGRVAVEFDVSIFGPWKKKLGKGSRLTGRLSGGKFFSPEQMARLFNGSKVVLNVHTWFGKYPYGTNPRVFEACGCGAFQISDRKQEITELYAEDEDIVLYDDADELCDKLGHYLRHDSERRRIADNAYVKTHARHTYAHRLEEMLKVCGLS